MKKYIDGFYCRNDVELKIINKTPNREILNALQQAYPAGLNVKEISKKADVPEKTIYTLEDELYKNYYISVLETKRSPGRPISQSGSTQARYSRKVVIEEAEGIYDIHKGKTPLPPGNVLLNEDFKDAWSQIIEKEKGQKEELCLFLIHYLQKTFDRISNNKELRKWAPKRETGCCTQCGLNHEARDFMRATLLCLINEVQESCRFVDFMKEKEFLTHEAYDRLKVKFKRN